MLRRFGPHSRRVQYEVSPDSGLPYRWKASMRQYERSYNEVVSKLLRERGVPAFSMKRYLVPDEISVNLLDTDQGMEEVDAFPHDVNDNMCIFRGGTVRRWGNAMSVPNGSSAVVTKQGTLIVISDTREPIFVGRLPDYPDTIVVRSGSSWVGAFHEGGKLLSSAHRE